MNLRSQWYRKYTKKQNERSKVATWSVNGDWNWSTRLEQSSPDYHYVLETSIDDLYKDSFTFKQEKILQIWVTMLPLVSLFETLACAQ